MGQVCVVGLGLHPVVQVPSIGVHHLFVSPDIGIGEKSLVAPEGFQGDPVPVHPIVEGHPLREGDVAGEVVVPNVEDRHWAHGG